MVFKRQFDLFYFRQNRDGWVAGSLIYGVTDGFEIVNGGEDYRLLHTIIPKDKSNGTSAQVYEVANAPDNGPLEELLPLLAESVAALRAADNLWVNGSAGSPYMRLCDECAGLASQELARRLNIEPNNGNGTNKIMRKKTAEKLGLSGKRVTKIPADERVGQALDTLASLYQ